MEDNKTFGLGSLAQAALSGYTTQEIMLQRFKICASCHIKDMDGERLYRKIDGDFYCGTPRLSELTKIRRDERHWGCGCLLRDKVSYNGSECPFGVWQAAQG